MVRIRPLPEVISGVGCRLRNAPSRKLGDRSIRCRRSPRGSRPNEGWLTSAAAAMANTPIAPSMKRKILSIVVTL